MHTGSDQSSRHITRRTILASLATTSAAGLAGCLGTRTNNPDNPDDGNPDPPPADEFVIVVSVQDSPDQVTRDWEPVADWIEAYTNVPTRIDPVQDDSAAIAALAAGQAHLAYPSGGPSWVGWQRFSLETLVVEADEAGRTSYTAAAWVRADSDIHTLADLQGVDSCHTGDLKGAGMLIPMASLAHEDLVSFDDTDDITAIRGAVDEFFDNPVVGGGYVGALQCLSQGQGDVAFVRASTPEDYCGGPDPESWCLDLDEYRMLEGFAEVPSHPVLVHPETSPEHKDLLRDALLALNDDPDGQRILAEVFGVAQLKPATSEDHLGPYGELIEVLPGIEDHLLG